MTFEKYIRNGDARNEKHINIDDVINIDFIKEYHVLHEVKKSRKIEQASIWQVKYYLYYLKQHGIIMVTGQIDYPLIKQTVQVGLTIEDEEIIMDSLEDIRQICSVSKPPQYEKSKICKSCAYFDLCAI